MDSIKIYNKIDRLRLDKGISANKLCKAAGVSHNTLYTWKKRRSMPTFEVLDSLCDVLNISLSQLFTDEKLDDLTSEQKVLIEDWSTLNKNHKNIIKDMIKALRGLTKE